MKEGTTTEAICIDDIEAEVFKPSRLCLLSCTRMHCLIWINRRNLPWPSIRPKFKRNFAINGGKV
uniref:Uncharacterized protein n=1 Tax=Triticum urartu TaxID=4572 RepID=A0A8R7VBP8_TRIUA